MKIQISEGIFKVIDRYYLCHVVFKGSFPLSRNFYVRTCVKFTLANKRGIVRKVAQLHVYSQYFIFCLYFIYVTKIYVPWRA